MLHATVVHWIPYLLPRLAWFHACIQTKSRQDVHSLSEDLYQQLALMEADVMHKLAKGGAGSNGRKGGSNTGGGGAADILVAPPVEGLRCMHPLYLAERAGHLTARDADENQKRQLGVFMQVCGQGFTCQFFAVGEFCCGSVVW